MAKAAVSVRAYQSEHVDVAAGVLWDDGRLLVGFTRDADAHLAALRARVGRPDLLAAFTAEHPEQELRALQDRITADMAVLERLGVDVSMVAVDERRNRVIVGLRGRNAKRGEAVLARRYDRRQFVVEAGVEVHPVADTTAAPPPRSGHPFPP